MANFETERIITVERRLKLTPRICAACGRAFAGWGRQRFCGKPCQRKWDYQQHAEARCANRRDAYRKQRDQTATDATNPASQG